MEAARPATEADLDHLVWLCDRALAELAPTRGGEVFVAREARAVPVVESFREAFADPDRSVWVGTVDRWPVGYAVAHVEQLRNGEGLGVIEDIFVEHDARDIGVGEALIEAVLAWLRRRGCAGVDAYALPGNRGTKNFFETAGFSARLLVMHHRLGPER